MEIKAIPGWHLVLRDGRRREVAVESRVERFDTTWHATFSYNGRAHTHYSDISAYAAVIATVHQAVRDEACRNNCLEVWQIGWPE